ncbi:DUF4921 family protein [Dermatophilus congolensis]|nr:DUF4921 family protein [Dermatophilus congolensis]MBO3143559.1 DUF4921 family protein [Dermatophilus congolensis]MBO3152550.1 DUF4921 family protein [Dermatophilus congolensis]MBO3160439.1 DUF4921 family protein [Dermatophilus congolensis]MBO3163836.1 DUF4921 family protein [Dermatophilus congolensis]MBO3177382.1 DUF4921 family protein [Dermatophilus congolensis]
MDGPVEPVRRLADGTVKQVNPFSGTQVWTVPGRASRPVGSGAASVGVVSASQARSLCAFCEGQRLSTPPERERVVWEGGQWVFREGLSAGEVAEQSAEFRRVPNLFAILDWPYWRDNHGLVASGEVLARRDAYLADSAGREHVVAVLRAKAAAMGCSVDGVPAEGEREALAQAATGFFAGGHEVVIGRRHVTNAGKGVLAGSGTLSAQEHAAFMELTVRGVVDLYERIPVARYVVAFQNWLRPAGASFDHLHKQIVAIDEYSEQTNREVERLRVAPDAFWTWGVGYAARRGLLIAENEHAVAFAGFGHRWPAVEVFSKGGSGLPWELSVRQRRDVSDLVHAVHAATGVDVPVNEEWHYRPPGLGVPMPWRVVVKWRISNVAGFEGGTKIYVNTIDPWGVRDRVVAGLVQLRASGGLADGVAVGQECWAGALRYV